MKSNLSLGAMQEIESEKYFENHLNFLFRTDAEQKFTNDHTNSNLVFTWNGFQLDFYEYGDTLAKRKLIKSQLRSKIYGQYENVNQLGIGTVFIDLEGEDDEVIVIDEEVLTDIMHLLKSTSVPEYPLVYVLLVDINEIPRLQYIFERLTDDFMEGDYET